MESMLIVVPADFSSGAPAEREGDGFESAHDATLNSGQEVGDVIRKRKSRMDEAISPELALVCPELRLKAIAALPDPDWDAVLARVRLRAAAIPSVTARRRGIPEVLAPLVVAAIAFAGVFLLTLTLTLIADSMR
jgi:hypothetical protein